MRIVQAGEGKDCLSEVKSRTYSVLKKKKKEVNVKKKKAKHKLLNSIWCCVFFFFLNKILVMNNLSV